MHVHAYESAIHPWDDWLDSEKKRSSQSSHWLIYLGYPPDAPVSSTAKLDSVVYNKRACREVSPGLDARGWLEVSLTYRAKRGDYRYLGVPIGMRVGMPIGMCLGVPRCAYWNDPQHRRLDSIIPQLLEGLEAIRNSLLASWQKLDAILIFLQAVLTYVLRAGDPQKQSLTEYRRKLIRTLREICDLPTPASHAYFFASKIAGCLALQDHTAEADIQCIVQTIRILSASDPTVASVARAELMAVVRRTTRSNPSPNLVCRYLSDDSDNSFTHLYYTYTSLWSRCRMSCRRLKIRFIPFLMPNIRPSSLLTPARSMPVLPNPSYTE